ncbi:unnamed protein product [Umbelopsis vinacea]
MVRIASLTTLLMTAVLTMAAPIPSGDDMVTLTKRTTYSGRGTWFSPDSPNEGGNTGACGGTFHDSSAVVALNHKQYGNVNGKSKYCGKKISITGPHGTTTATIKDACPDSACTYGALDMTPAVFKKVIGNLNIGEHTIKWHFV